MTLASVRETSNQLYNRYLGTLTEELEGNAAFVLEARLVVNQLKEAAVQTEYRQDYEWIRDSLEKWRGVFLSVLKIPEDISIPAPGRLLKTAQTTGRCDIDPDEWLRKRAYELAKERAVRKVKQATAEEILRQNPSTDEEAFEDWAVANALLACEILDGGIELTQLRSRWYGRLESCWLEEIKRLKAYFRWQQRGNGFDTELEKQDYYDACNEVQLRILQADRKRSPSEFEAVGHYVRARYLKGHVVDPSKARPLIATKARRLWELGASDAARNWLAAEQYVKGFYGNIITAAEGNADACNVVAALVCAFDSDSVSAQVNSAIVNVLEAVLVAYFVDVAGGWHSRLAAVA